MKDHPFQKTTALDLINEIVNILKSKCANVSMNVIQEMEGINELKGFMNNINDLKLKTEDC